MITSHTSESLPVSVAQLFRLNNFEVSGPMEFNGAEVDLVATSKSDPFASPIYIEVTVEYVGNEKYGKDTTKALLFREKDPSSRFLIVSSKGFSLPVQERAKASRIETLTYDQLFQRFEKFDPYCKSIFSSDNLAQQLSILEARYEEPNFNDLLGLESATEFLTAWKNDPKEQRRWLVVVGEYGTGKTALTQILVRRWLREYQKDPSRPIPIRLELREFTRQFDAKGLLHHFLDKHGMSHIPIEFMLSLIRTGRIVLILDGYDEMAQFLNVHERRACLEALAQFAADGAKGILTSRPNYFSEAEELRVMETLYMSLDNFRYISKDYTETIAAEKAVDSLLGSQFINRFERTLQDLTPTQTEALIDRVLITAPQAKSVVLDILRYVFREVESGEKRSLSGKPVIITYLLEIAEDLRNDQGSQPKTPISEWDVYSFIFEKLMLRDFKRTPGILPAKRASFLQHLAIVASKRGTRVLSEENFRDLILKLFSKEINSHRENKEEEIQRYFGDLRSSATLTRTSDTGYTGWTFSHNSLREFLCAQYLMERLKDPVSSFEPVVVTDAMKTFVGSKPPSEIRDAIKQLALKMRSGHRHSVSTLLCVLWDGISKQDGPRAVESSLAEIAEGLDFTEMVFDRIQISSARKPVSLPKINLQKSVISDCSFEAADLTSACFSGATLQNVSFASAKLSGATFSYTVLSEVDFSQADVSDMDINNLDSNSSIIYDKRSYSGNDALGLLVFLGAKNSNVEPIHVLQHHPSFGIAQKIARKLVEGGLRQERGLAQRGAARQDTEFAHEFLAEIEKMKLTACPTGRDDLVEITDLGRRKLGDIVEKRSIDPQLALLFK